jgi:HlyD family secretion protein
VPQGASVVDSRAEGQVASIPVRVGERVRRGDPLVQLYLPVLEQELHRQKRDLVELERINVDLNRRDAARLEAAKRVEETSLAQLRAEARRVQALQSTYRQKVADLRHLARRAVVAPLSREVVDTEDRSTQLAVQLDNLRIREKQAIDSYEKVKLEVATEAQRRLYRIDDARRGIAVTRQRIAYDGVLRAVRDGRVLDLQVVKGQTVKPGQRLGTLGGRDGDALQAVAYFGPADARRLAPGMAVELVPHWGERGRFGGVQARVDQVSLLPATREDVDTTLGNPQLAEALVREGPVMRTLISLRRGSSDDGLRWTLSRGSSVFPIRQGLTLDAHAYVEWRPPITYVLPVLRDLTGSYRTLWQLRQDTPDRRQQEALP